MNAGPPRLAPLGPDERTEEQEALYEQLRQGVTSNIYATIVRAPVLAERMVALGKALRRGSLSHREREILILRIAARCDSPYEHAQHRVAARWYGMSDEDIDRVVTDAADADGWTPREQALLRVADELHATASLSDGTWAALAAVADEPTRIEVLLLAGYYHLVAFVANGLRIPVEETTS